jgi:hypothetical protein
MLSVIHCFSVLGPVQMFSQHLIPYTAIHELLCIRVWDVPCGSVVLCAFHAHPRIHYEPQENPNIPFITKNISFKGCQNVSPPGEATSLSGPGYNIVTLHLTSKGNMKQTAPHTADMGCHLNFNIVCVCMYIIVHFSIRPSGL